MALVLLPIIFVLVASRRYCIAVFVGKAIRIAVNFLLFSGIGTANTNILQYQYPPMILVAPLMQAPLDLKDWRRLNPSIMAQW